MSCDSVKSAMPLAEFYYAARPEMQNNHPISLIVVLGVMIFRSQEQARTLFGLFSFLVYAFRLLCCLALLFLIRN